LTKNRASSHGYSALWLYKFDAVFNEAIIEEKALMGMTLFGCGLSFTQLLLPVYAVKQ